MTREELGQLAGEAGLDLLGVTTCRRLQQRLPAELHPSSISEYLPTFLCTGVRIPVGVSQAADNEAKVMACALVHRHLEEATTRLAYELEAREYLAVVIPSLAMDFRQRDELSNTPAGQASLFLRLAAVEAGLGTLGLNNMLLTPRYGPRVYLAGVMTNLQMRPDEPLQEELCPGLQECGRCAAVCPAGAIPRRAPLGAPLESYRDLDAPACARHSQPYGPQAFVDYVQLLVQDEETPPARLEDPMFARLWYHMTVARQGAFTGCSRCLQVCPVGEDYPQVQASPLRRRDLPQGFRARVEGGFAFVEHCLDHSAPEEEA